LEELYDFVGTKAALRFRTMRQCLLAIDQNHKGKITRAEARGFFRTLNLATDMADRFFDLADAENSGAIGVAELHSRLARHLQPGYRSSKGGGGGCDEPPPSTVRAASAPHHQERRDSSSSSTAGGGNADLLSLIRAVCEKAREKHKNVRDLFRRLDENKDGAISREELARFVMGFGLSRDASDRVFEELGRDAVGRVDYLAFAQFFAPLLQPGHSHTRNPRQQTQQSRSSSSRPSPSGSAGGSAAGRHTSSGHGGGGGSCSTEPPRCNNIGNNMAPAAGMPTTPNTSNAAGASSVVTRKGGSVHRTPEEEAVASLFSIHGEQLQGQALEPNMTGGRPAYSTTNRRGSSGATALKGQRPPSNASSAQCHADGSVVGASASAAGGSSSAGATPNAGNDDDVVRRRGNALSTPRGDLACFVPDLPRAPAYSPTYDSSCVQNRFSATRRPTNGRASGPPHLAMTCGAACGSPVDDDVSMSPTKRGSWHGPVLAAALMF